MKIPDKVYHHLAALAGFVVVALLFFYPVLQGKEIYQSDIVQYTGMAKEQNDFRAREHQEPYWTNSAFGGMPTYQLGAHYPHNYVKMLDSAIRFLPRPADYLFLYFASFYVLMLVLRADPLKAFFGALAFGFSTYLIIILGVGHNAKAHAIGYMPLVVAGVLLVFRKKYILGGLLTMFAAALEINANHFQMTYYLLFLLLVIGIVYGYRFIKERDFGGLGRVVGTFALAGLFAVGANAANLMATSEYADFSTRGKSQLTFNPDGSPKTSDVAMSREYITEYSYGIAESFNLIIPRLFGGSNSENLGTDSELYQFLISMGVPENQAADFASGLPLYWGDQPIVAAPAYIGAVVFFLAVIGLILVRSRIRYALLAGAILSLMLSWGKNFPALTDFFIDYIPLYNKFRAISSIQVILELCMPALAVLGLNAFFTSEKARQWKALWMSAAVSGGIIVLLLVMKGSFAFEGGYDEMFMKQYGAEFVSALRSDRMALYSADLLRTGFLTLLAAALLWMAMKDKLKTGTAVILIGLVMVGDLFFIGRNYLNSKNFVASREMRQPFQMTQADSEILEDTTHFRVFDIDGNMNSARASYFHKSLGGYHAAKPRRIQELVDYQLSKGNVEILNMFNVKYILQQNERGDVIPSVNERANGNAWFVSALRKVNSADEEIKALTKLNTKETAIINTSEFGEFANKKFGKDSTASIQLTSYKPNKLTYVSNNSVDGLAVFSEVYYPKGWKSFVDGKEVPHFRVDYTLRAMMVPAGKHTIEFRFEPTVVKTGGTISLASSLGMLLLLGVGIYYARKKDR